MLRRFVALNLVLGVASIANADVVISITPQTAGPYAPGSTVTMNVNLSQVNVSAGDPQPIQGLRFIQFDYADSSPELTLGALGGTPQVRRVAWDFSSIVGGSAAYFQDRDLTTAPAKLVTVAFTGTDYPNGDPLNPGTTDGPPCEEICPWNQTMFVLPASGSYRVQTLAVTLPVNLGTYTIDPLNADAVVQGNPTLGAAVQWGFGVHASDPVVSVQPSNTAGGGGLSFDGFGTFFPDGAGGFAYGVPEPATLVLLALGGMAALRRRRTA